MLFMLVGVRDKSGPGSETIKLVTTYRDCSFVYFGYSIRERWVYCEENGLNFKLIELACPK